MNHSEIVNGLRQLGLAGWSVYGDDYDSIDFAGNDPKPTAAAIAAAAKLWIDTHTAAKTSAQTKLAALGLTADEIAAL